MSAPEPDTADLRTGAPIHNNLFALLPLLGVWRGSGTGVIPSTGAEFAYGQQCSFVHDGRPFLAYESRSWLLNPDGTVIQQAWRESGFWRPGADLDVLEVMLASQTGQVLMYTGVADDLRWEIHTTLAEHALSARHVDGERRLFALVGDELSYATELAPGGQPYAAHLNARLARL